MVGRMGGVRVLVRVNNRREGHADASSVGGLLPVPSAGVRTWLTQSLEHGRTAVAEREPPKLPHLRHIALEPAHVAQQGAKERAIESPRPNCRHDIRLEFIETWRWLGLRHSGGNQLPTRLRRNPATTAARQMLSKRRCCDILSHRHVAASIGGISGAAVPVT